MACNFQEIYNVNAGNSWNTFINPGGPAIDLAYSENERKSKQILTSSINNHSWTGLLSTLNHKVNEKFDFSIRSKLISMFKNLDNF